MDPTKKRRPCSSTSPRKERLKLQERILSEEGRHTKEEVANGDGNFVV